MLVTLNVGRNTGNGILKQAKKALVADNNANAVKKSTGKSLLKYSGMTAFNAGLTSLDAACGSTAWAVIFGLFTALTCSGAGINLLEYLKFSKNKKQTARALNDIVNNDNFKDVLNRYLRMNGENKMTSEQIVKDCKKGKYLLNAQV